MFQNIGTTEIIIIAVVIVVLFGGKKLPGLGKGLGESIKELKGSVKDEPKKKTKNK